MKITPSSTRFKRLVFSLLSLMMLACTTAFAATPATPPIIKLGRFAAACDAPQIADLLKRETSFDINAYPATLTPVQLAQERLLAAIKSADPAYQNACSATVKTIMSDSRYDWRGQPSLLLTDLMHLINGMRDAPSPAAVIELAVVVETLKTFSGAKAFDINYRIKAPHSTYNVATVAGAVAASGNAVIWCAIRKAFPLIDLEMRPSTAYYTPLIIAVASNRLEMVKYLVGSGADWYVSVDDIPDPFAAQKLAANSGFKDIETWLILHSQAKQIPLVCK